MKNDNGVQMPSELLEVIKKTAAIEQGQKDLARTVDRRFDAIETALKSHMTYKENLQTWMIEKDKQISVLSDRSNLARKLSIGSILAVVGILIKDYILK